MRVEGATRHLVPSRRPHGQDPGTAASRGGVAALPSVATEEGVTDAGTAAGTSGLTTMAVAVDVALLTVREGTLQLLLVEPDASGYAGTWALPGGRVGDDETLDDAARRILRTVAGIDALVDPDHLTHLEQLRTYGDPRRDARARVVSVAYLAFTPIGALPAAMPDGPTRRFVPATDLAGLGGEVRLAFDHDRIVPDAVERVRAKLEYTPLALAFVEEPFTLGDVRQVYEAVWGLGLDRANFRRKVTTTPGFVVPTGETAPPGRGGGRPPALYRRGTARALHPPMLRADPG